MREFKLIYRISLSPCNNFRINKSVCNHEFKVSFVDSLQILRSCVLKLTSVIGRVTQNMKGSLKPIRNYSSSKTWKPAGTRSFKLMAQKIMKEVFDSYFEIGKLNSWTMCHSNILRKKYNENVLELHKVGSKICFWDIVGHFNLISFKF